MQAIECLPRRLFVAFHCDYFAVLVPPLLCGIVRFNELDCRWVVIGELVCECLLGFYVLCNEMVVVEVRRDACSFLPVFYFLIVPESMKPLLGTLDWFL